MAHAYSHATTAAIGGKWWCVCYFGALHALVAGSRQKHHSGGESPDAVGGGVLEAVPGQIGVGDKAKRESGDEWGCNWVRTEVYD